VAAVARAAGSRAGVGWHRARTLKLSGWWDDDLFLCEDDEYAVASATEAANAPSPAAPAAAAALTATTPPLFLADARPVAQTDTTSAATTTALAVAVLATNSVAATRASHWPAIASSAPHSQSVAGKAAAGAGTAAGTGGTGGERRPPCCVRVVSMGGGPQHEAMVRMLREEKDPETGLRWWNAVVAFRPTGWSYTRTKG